MKIGLDAGHTYNTAGKRTPDDIREWTLNNAVCNYIAEYLNGYVDILRTDDTTGTKDIGLSTRRNKAINNNCDVLISIHHNAYSGSFSNVTGIETYTHTKYATEKAKQISIKIAEKMANNTGLKNRGVKQANFSVIATSRIPAILCEGGFMDGEKDSYYIRTEEGQRAYAKAVADTIKEQYNLTGGKTTSSNTANSNNKNSIEFFQKWLNENYNTKLAVDGIYGAKTKSGTIKALQTELNKQYNKNLVVDGIFGTKTKNACVTVRKGAKGNITYIMQAMLYIKKYNTNGVDGDFGSGTESAIKHFQKVHGLTTDGVCGKNTWAKLCV